MRLNDLMGNLPVLSIKTVGGRALLGRDEPIFVVSDVDRTAIVQPDPDPRLPLHHPLELRETELLVLGMRAEHEVDQPEAIQTGS